MGKPSAAEMAWRQSHNIYSPYLSPEEDAAIVSSILAQPELYMEDSLYLIDKDSKFVQYTFWRCQRIVHLLVQKLRCEKKPVRLIILKARQVGISTWIVALMYTMMRFIPNLRARLVSHLTESAKANFHKIITFHENQPEETRPLVHTKTRTELKLGNKDTKTLFEYPGLGSSMSISTARNLGIGRGDTIQFCHLTEVAHWPKPKQTLRAILNAVPYSAETFMFLETSSNGAGDFFYKEFMKAYEGESDIWTPVFLPYWLQDEYKVNLTPEEELEIISSADEYEKALKNKFKTFSWGHIAWRRQAIAEKCHGSVLAFNMEFPGTVEEAFAASGESLFDLHSLLWYRDNTVRDGKKGKLVVDANRRTPRLVADEDGDLTVWHRPEPGEQYFIGADAAMGKKSEGLMSGEELGGEDEEIDETLIDSDFCASVVIDSKKRQVAQFHTNVIDPYAFGDELCNLGVFYNHATIMLEVGTQGAGQGAQKQLKELGYHDLGRWEQIDATVKRLKPYHGWEVNSRALPLDAPVLTPNGWVTMGDLRAGMWVVGRAADTVVTGVYDQGEKEIFRVTFRDGAVVEASGDHFWQVFDRKGQRDRLLTTQEILDQGLRDTKGWRWQVPLHSAPVVFGPKDLPLSAYTLGLLLGDGCFRNGTPKFTNRKMELVNALNPPKGVIVKEIFLKRGLNSRDWLLSGEGRKRKNALTQILEELGLWGTDSHTKFIPELYLRAMPQDRLALLQGLMDTDGTINKRNGVTTYSTVSEKLAIGVQELVRSLGGLSHVNCYERLNGWSNFYLVHVNLPKTMSPFLNEVDKLAKFRGFVERYNALPSCKKTTRLVRAITSIVHIGSKPCRCIKVGAADGLFTAADYVLTHNTKAMVVGIMQREVMNGAGRLYTTPILKDPHMRDRLILRSEDLINELSSFAIHSDGGVGARSGSHDDLVIAMGMALLALRQTGSTVVVEDNMKQQRKLEQAQYLPQSQMDTDYGWMDA